MKITVIGGGSYAWTPRLVTDFLMHDFFKGVEICLYDIAKEPLEDIHALCNLYQESLPNEISFTKTMNLTEALTGANYVVVAISHGGLEAELEDHRIARRHGFYNLKGSEVGVAGCSRTLRHVPEFIRIARQMEKICPNAMMLNVTNPLSAITRCVNKYTSIKAFGFCHGVMNHLSVLLQLFGAEKIEDVDFVVAGVDHISFQLAIKYKGQDALQIIKEGGWIEKAKNGDEIALYDDAFAGVEGQRLRFIIWDILGYLPAISDTHCAEFFGQIMKDEQTRNHFGITYDRITARANTVAKHRQEVKEILAGKPMEKFEKSGEIIAKFIAALNGAGSFIDVLNAPNRGQVENLPMGTVVETKCLIDSNGVHPIIAGPLPAIVESIVRPIALREELYMEAAAEDNLEKLVAALSMDPSVNDFINIREVAEELMNYNRQFWN